MLVPPVVPIAIDPVLEPAPTPAFALLPIAILLPALVLAPPAFNPINTSSFKVPLVCCPAFLPIKTELLAEVAVDPTKAL